MQKVFSNVIKLKLIALISGCIGIALALATPLLPVRQTTATVTWPQTKTANITLPLVSYVPEKFSTTIPCSLLLKPQNFNKTIISTIPISNLSENNSGFFVNNISNNLPISLKKNLSHNQQLDIYSQGILLKTYPLHLLKKTTCRTIDITISWNTVEIKLAGVNPNIAVRHEVKITDSDLRPQIVGVFTDLPLTELTKYSDLRSQINIDDRYTVSPTLIRWLAITLGIIFSLISFITLARLDAKSGRKNVKLFNKRFIKPNRFDAIVISLLLIWYFIGANTSDDGYILTMARSAANAHYPTNYYRWFAAPEAPFGWYYYIFSFLTRFSTASIWVRLPSLICAILVWFLINHEVIPRLGKTMRNNSLPKWSAAMVLLAFWFPFNNGLRPEPIIALGTLLTWCLFERAIASRQLFPAALGLIVSGFTIACGPTGIITIGIILVSIPVILGVIITKAKFLGNKFTDYLTFIIPLISASLFILYITFYQLTLRTFLEKARMQTSLGPTRKWFDEPARYASLLGFTEDGSLARRFPVFLSGLAILIIGTTVLRKIKLPGVAKGPVIRIVAALIGSFFLLMFTPTKWTHHFGVFAGISTAVIPIFVISLSAQIETIKRNRVLISSFCFFVIAFAFTGPNKWWSYSGFGTPWSDSAFKIPLILKPISIGTIVFGLAILSALYAGWLTLIMNHKELENLLKKLKLKKFNWSGSWPLTLMSILVIITEFSSFIYASLITQKNTYSIGKTNFKSLFGKNCGLAEYVLVENNPNKGFLIPENTTLKNSLTVSYRKNSKSDLSFDNHFYTEGFTPNGLPNLLLPLNIDQTLHQLPFNPNYPDLSVGLISGNKYKTINGSSAQLPYGLNPDTTPVIGNWQGGHKFGGNLVTDWFALPSLLAKTEHDKDLLAITVAGNFTPDEIKLEYSTKPKKLNRTTDGEIKLIDNQAEYQPIWRNLRINRSALPESATAIRIVINIATTAIGHWIAITPPRAPQLITLQDLIGNNTPTLIDWTSGLVFPCQQPFKHYAGVATIPKWRIMPSFKLADNPNSWQDSAGGGPLGWQQPLLDTISVPTYLLNDLYKDWGELKRLTPRYPSAKPAIITYTTRINSGWFSPAPIRH